MRILIATDGSEFSQAAVERACELIRDPNDTEIKLVSVFRTPTIATEPFLAAPDYYQGVSESLEALAESYVDKARKTIEKSLPNAVVTNQVVMGSPAQMIVEIAEESDAEMIVIGSHGRGFWSRSLLGSVSDAVVHHAPCSVLVVRSTGPEKSVERSQGNEESR